VGVCGNQQKEKEGKQKRDEEMEKEVLSGVGHSQGWGIN